MANNENLIPAKKGEVRNPNGRPKGSKNLATHIQNMLNDPDFELKLKDGSILKEMPLQAIIKTAIAKGISGNVQWAEWLAKHGYGEKQIHEFENPIKLILEKYGIDASETEDS